MKVAYDISVLGQGFVNPKAKTGVYRVVESLFFELIQHPDIEFNPIALNNLSNFWDEMACCLYLQNQPQLSPDIPLLESCYQRSINLTDLYLLAVRIQKELLQSALKINPILYKPSLGFQWLLKRIASQITDAHFPKDSLVYHSPFYGFYEGNKQDLKTSRILTVYDLIPILYPEMFTSSVYHKFLSTLKTIDLKNDWVICDSFNTKQDFCQYTKMNSERVFVTHLAAGDSFYPVENQSIIKDTMKRYHLPQKPYLLSLCTLEPRKNLSFLLRCFAEVIKQNPTLEMNLVLVGVSGWKNADIFETITKDNLLKDRVIFTGYVADEDLSAIYSGALAFVYPSLYEGFGLPPLEAMQCGTPVITSNTSSLPEVVGDAGIMIDPTQEDELCQALLDIINDAKLRENLSLKGSERAKQFTWKRCADETVKVYQIAVNS